MDPQPRNDDYRQFHCASMAYHRDSVAPPHRSVTAAHPVARAVVVVVAVAAEDGARLADCPPARRVDHEHCFESDLGQALILRGRISGVIEPQTGVTEPALLDEFAAKVLVVPSSAQWREAMSTALLGSWSDPLVQTGRLPDTAVLDLRADARSLHRDLTPLWLRGTRHGRVLSLDASLGDGLSFYDLVAADIGLLARVTGGVVEDDRLNRVLRCLAPAERATVFAYAEGEGTTWAEAATAAGAADPDAFGERVRRKVKRLAAEQARRTAMARPKQATDHHTFTPDADAP